MASPFRYFRKHTKAFMAIAAVMCMFLFVFASGTGGGPGSEDRPDATAPVASWNAGSLNVSQLAGLVQQRLITDQFLQMLFVQGGGQSRYDLPTNVPELLLQSDRPEAVELEVVNTEVFSSLATEAGITVDNAMINEYLYQFGLKRVGSDEIQGILSTIASRDVRSNTAIVFSTVRKLLLAYFYRRAYEDAGAVVLPAERWDDWRRVNERISVQAAALPIEEFLDEVPKPTDAQLRQLYDEYANAEPNLVMSVGGRELPSPNPGFAEPRRVTLQYLLGSVAERTQNLLDTVTEEQIADYYERNKRLEFVKADEAEEEFGDDAMEGEGEPADGEDPAAGDEAATDGEAAADEAAQDGAEASDEDTTPEADATTEPAADAADEPSDQPSDEPSDEADPAPASDEAAPADGEAAPTDDEAAPAAGEGDQSSTGADRSPFRLTALQVAPAEGEATDDEAAADATTEEGAEPAADATSGEAAVVDEAVAEDAEADADATATETTPVAGEDGPPGEGTGAEQPADEDAPKDGAKPGEEDGEQAAAVVEEAVEYEPLENVRDEIRETLAREKAVVELGDAIGKAAVKLQAEYLRYGRQVVEARTLKRTPPKVPANLASLDWLAGDYGLTVAATDPLTDRELFETAVGKAVDEQSGRINVTQAAFVTLEAYEPFVAKELEGDWYLVTKTKDTPRRVPKFDEVRDQVEIAWKRIEAAKLAEKKAEELAEAAEAATEPFAEFFADEDVTVVEQTALFSWRSYPVGPGLGYPPELSDVPELKNVGPAFMEAAFGLDGTETVGLMNYDRSVAYVVRLHSRQYTLAELKKLFLEEETSWPGRMDMLREHQYEFSQIVNRRIWEDLAGFEFDPEWERRRDERLAESQ